jgi:DNA-binding NtrC family response regulator
MLLRVLVHADAPTTARLERLLPRADLFLESAPGDGSAAAQVRGQGFDLLLLSAPSAGSLEDQLREVVGLPDAPQVIVLTAAESVEQQASLLAAGAYAVLHQGFADDELGPALVALLDRRRDEQLALLDIEHPEDPEREVFVSKSPAMKRMLEMIGRVAAASSPVLILGETGVGKERVANLIHAQSPRAAGPFVALNCAAIPAELVESELFGHEKGAFTGASKTRRGYFELAHGGTLFLDEVGEIPLDLQAKLLRALDEKKIRPIGSDRLVNVDVRVVAATNRNLEAEIEARRFRSDLYYRLSVVDLEIPPLRERPEDVEELLRLHVRRFAEMLGRDVRGVTPEAKQALMHYDWPGNVRELKNVVERAVLLCLGTEVSLSDLPRNITAPFARGPVEVDEHPEAELAPDIPTSETAALDPTQPIALPETWLTRPWKEVREDLLREGERTYLSNLLRATGGRVGVTARRAGMAERSLFEKMKRHGLRKEDFRPSED